LKIYTKQAKVLFSVYFLIGTGFALLRPVFSDEGYYIWAARNVLHGKILYVDFIFHQLPLLPILYAPFSELGLGTYYILKYISVLSTLGLAILLYRHVLKVTSNYIAAYFAVLLLIFNGLFVDFNSIAKMFALVNLLCYFSFYLVSFVKFNSTTKDKIIFFCTGLISSLASNMRIMFWSCTVVLFLYLAYKLFRELKQGKQKYFYISYFLAGVLFSSIVTIYYYLSYTDEFIFGNYKHNLYSQQNVWTGGENLIKWLKFFFMPQNLMLFIFMIIGITQKFKYKVPAILFFLALLASHSPGYFIDEYLTVLIPYVIYIGAVNYNVLKKKLIYKGRSFIKYAVIIYVFGFFITTPYFRYMITGRILEPNLLQLNEMIEYEKTLKGEKILSSWYIYTLYSNKVNDTLNNNYVYSTMIGKLSPEECRKYGLPDSSLISNLIKEKYYDVIVQNETTPHVLLQHKEMIKDYYKLDRVFGNSKYFVK